MDEGLVKTMTDFGFTVNQAKVYLSIVRGAYNVGSISKQTQLHRQDIYKILPKLEKMGLITRTLDKPFRFEAIAIEKALDNLISKEKKKANEKIACLENHLKEVVVSLKEQSEKREPIDAGFTLLTNDNAIENMANMIFKKARKEVNILTNMELLNKPAMRYYMEFIQELPKNKAKSSIVLLSVDDKEKARKTIEQIAPDSGAFIVKVLNRKIQRQYQIIDRKEVCIAVQLKTETGVPCMLWTNDKNIVDVYVEHFNKMWSHSQANILYQTVPIKENEKQKGMVPNSISV
jgi:sugar-specific transcriptional regulator TrmB